MSASLVGSEMCIRDRDAGYRPTFPAPCGAPPIMAGRKRAPAATRGGPEAVSYTHLTLPTICSV
eukprot:11195804-Alexandrium_andersonii.AAC.1